jgi:hypothetical protein
MLRRRVHLAGIRVGIEAAREVHPIAAVLHPELVGERLRRSLPRLVAIIGDQHPLRAVPLESAAVLVGEAVDARPR